MSGASSLARVERMLPAEAEAELALRAEALSARQAEAEPADLLRVMIE